jgi:hypothetical protein
MESQDLMETRGATVVAVALGAMAVNLVAFVVLLGVVEHLVQQDLGAVEDLLVQVEWHPILIKVVVMVAQEVMAAQEVKVLPLTQPTQDKMEIPEAVEEMELL